MQGFDPMSLDFIRCAHEDKLGMGDPKDIEIKGEDISGVNFHFQGRQNTLASLGQKLIYHGCLHPFEKMLLRSPIVPWSYAASRLYHDVYWYRLIGIKRVKRILESEWGTLFQGYELSAYQKTHSRRPL